MDRLDPPEILQISFLLAASTMFCLNSLPHIKRRYLTYGPRSTWVNATARSGAAEKDSQGCLVSGTVLQLQRILGVVETIQVPHGWFTHFYVFSVMSSLYWGAQIVSKGNVLQSLCLRTKQPKSMSMERIILTWSLMAIQGVRRLAESILVNKRSRSRMWFAHWLLGICFYIAMGLAIWIEGSGTLLASQSVLQSLVPSAPSLRTFICLPVFLLASGIQHDCHVHLAALPKYSQPVHPIFQTIVCPHYTAECLLYLSLAFMAAPEGAWINRTIFSAFVFVSANLGVTASLTKEWYANKFGSEKVKHKWKMVPLIF